MTSIRRPQTPMPTVMAYSTPQKAPRPEAAHRAVAPWAALQGELREGPQPVAPQVVALQREVHPGIHHPEEHLGALKRVVMTKTNRSGVVNFSLAAIQRHPRLRVRSSPHHSDFRLVCRRFGYPTAARRPVGQPRVEIPVETWVEVHQAEVHRAEVHRETKLRSVIPARR